MVKNPSINHNLDITKIVRNMFQKSFILSCLYEYLISEFGAFAQFSFLTNIEYALKREGLFWDIL